MPDTSGEERVDLVDLDQEKQKTLKTIAANLHDATGETHNIEPPFDTHPLIGGEHTLEAVETEPAINKPLLEEVGDESKLEEFIEHHKGRGTASSEGFLGELKAKVSQQHGGAKVTGK